MGSRSGIVVRGLLFLFAAALVGCDHASKALARKELGEGRVIELISGVLDLRYTENHDTAFSLLHGVTFPYKSIVLGVVATAILVATAFVGWRRRHAPQPEPLGYALAAAGAVGNVTDRFARGFVVDFIHLKHWPVFNVADMLIVAGFLLIFISAVRARASSSGHIN